MTPVVASPNDRDSMPFVASPVSTVARLDESSPASLETPTADLSRLWDLGVAGVPLVQYLRWADDGGLFTALADHDTATMEALVARASLNARGVNALLGVLCAMHLVERRPGGFVLSDTGRQYLDRRSTFYVGVALYGMLDTPVPRRLRKGKRERRFSKATHSLWDRLRYFRSRNQWGRPERLLSQHSRNFPAAVVAVRAGHFDTVTHLVDVAGGSGVFVIPLARDRPDIRLTLVELPRSLAHIKPFLAEWGVETRVELRGFNMHETPWPIEQCDGVLFGNVLHFCDDEESLQMLRESVRLLPRGGRIFIHEMLWNDEKDGPLVTALWNFWLNSVSAGRQRTASEFTSLLTSAGCHEITVSATAGGFSLVTAVRR